MAVYIHTLQQPLEVLDGRQPSQAQARVRLAACDAGDLLLNEMRRYCRQEVEGRSVLLAGLRGAGKTTLVNSTVQTVKGAGLTLRPLRVDILGPNVFPNQEDGEASASQDPAQAAQDQGAPPTASAQVLIQVTGSSVPAVPAPAPAADVSRPNPSLDKESRQRILTQVVLAMYAALSSEIVRGFRSRVTEDLRGTRRAQQAYEVASTLEARLTEGPSLSELREYWRVAGALDYGVLFPDEKREGQGMLELVALAGLGYAYQRVSGDLKQGTKETASSTQQTERASGWDIRLAEIVKPLASLGTGAAVASAVAPKGLMLALVGGAISTVAAGTFFKFSTTQTEKQEEVHDRTFLPDTSAEHLDRVLPTLVARLKRAGLAPVVIIDELDKVPDLWARHEYLLSHMKKLFAERIFTCSLVNRNFMEELRYTETHDAYGKNFSYFTHRSYVAFAPPALHDYLDDVLEVRA